MRPLYAGYGFAQIPQTIRYCLTDSDQKASRLASAMICIRSTIR
jgi:hypothetical protein